MKAIITIYSNQVTERTYNVPSVPHARGIAKRALRAIPFQWAWAQVKLPDAYISYTIRKGKGQWDVTESRLPEFFSFNIETNQD
jgi:hypothetical protein